jgi:hypothetical protein
VWTDHSTFTLRGTSVFLYQTATSHPSHTSLSVREHTMALDSSLFTLTFQRRKKNQAILDLTPFQPAPIASSSSSSTPLSPLYSYSRAETSDYNVQLEDHLTCIPLSSISTPRSSDKIRKIQLYNPNEFVIFEKKNMTFRQEWRWTWQDQEYLARRDGRTYIVEAVRKPDPEIE